MFAKGVILFRYISHGKDLLANGAETIGNKFHKKHPFLKNQAAATACDFRLGERMEKVKKEGERTWKNQRKDT